MNTFIMPVMSAFTIPARYAAKGNFYKVRFRTNAGMETTSALAESTVGDTTAIWGPSEMKNLSNFNFRKNVKQFSN